MIILGIDPGTTATGYAVLDCAVSKPVLLESGLLRAPRDSAQARLTGIHDSLTSIIRKWRPASLAVPKLYFEKNKKTAMAVSETRGIILLTAAIQKITLSEYSPLEVKKAVTGYGRAEKPAVEKIIRFSVAGAESMNAKDDVFDAIAIAFTDHLLGKFKSRQNTK